MYEWVDGPKSSDYILFAVIKEYYFHMGEAVVWVGFHTRIWKKMRGLYAVVFNFKNSKNKRFSAPPPFLALVPSCPIKS